MFAFRLVLRLLRKCCFLSASTINCLRTTSINRCTQQQQQQQWLTQIVHSEFLGLAGHIPCCIQHYLGNGPTTAATVTTTDRESSSATTTFVKLGSSALDSSAPDSRACYFSTTATVALRRALHPLTLLQMLTWSPDGFRAAPKASGSFFHAMNTLLKYSNLIPVLFSFLLSLLFSVLCLIALKCPSRSTSAM